MAKFEYGGPKMPEGWVDAALESILYPADKETDILVGRKLNETDTEALKDILERRGVSARTTTAEDLGAIRRVMDKLGWDDSVTMRMCKERRDKKPPSVIVPDAPPAT